MNIESKEEQSMAYDLNRLGESQSAYLFRKLSQEHILWLFLPYMLALLQAPTFFDFLFYRVVFVALNFAAVSAVGLL